MLRVMVIAGMFLLLVGCSRVQLAYNQLDWLIPYFVEKEIQLTDNQDAYLQQSVEHLLSWHCSTHLDAYAGLLRTTNTRFQEDKMSKKELRELLEQIDIYWTEIKQQANPAITHLLLTSSDAQIDELFRNLAEKDNEWLERFNEQTDEELRLDYQKNMTRELERWFGPLQLSQQSAVVEWSAKFEPLGMEGFQIRQRWQARLRQLLDDRSDVRAFYNGIEQLFIHPKSLYSKGYLERIEHNTEITLALVELVGNELNDNQREHLANMIDSVSGDFVELACTEDGMEKQVNWELRDRTMSAP